ncbi:class E sortase [Microbacterium thalassium]|uniref:Sortase A n=1 Tax=Microbacterium thalassium TaxID=362649 RepID=A0A7X0FMR7_9MICO|nr:class E sortase [Microbacterium thalassium]MBB6390284.1 sortase A [Microbacterium thalassium]GLK25393.1 class E sortase [Microbacterium thalassium]
MSISTRHRPATVIGVIGELLMTVGVILLLYVAWQLWLGDVIYGAQANAQGNELSETWADGFAETDAATPTPITVPTPTAAPIPTPAPEDTEDVEPIILAEPSGTEDFAVLHVPRFGSDYAVPMAGGVTRAGTLDRQRIGHYPGTQMPGEIGNFAVAGHRTTYGAPFNRIAELRVGDPLVIETAVGWYTYRFRTLEYVRPDATDVLLPVPQAPDTPAGTRYMTMTSCSPLYSAAERIIAYSVFESFTPRAGGPPASLAGGA